MSTKYILLCIGTFIGVAGIYVLYSLGSALVALGVITVGATITLWPEL